MDDIIKGDENFVDVLKSKPDAIFAHPKSELTNLLVTLENEELQSIRSYMFEKLKTDIPSSTYCEGYELINRRKKRSLAEDIYLLGYTLANKLEDVRLKNIFKNISSNDIQILRETPKDIDNKDADDAVSLENRFECKKSIDDLKNLVRNMMRRIEDLETEITILKTVVAEKSSGEDNILHTPNKCLRENIIVSDESDDDSNDKGVESLTVNPKRQFLVKVDVHKDIKGNPQHNKSDKISGFRHTKEQRKQILKRKKHARPIRAIRKRWIQENQGLNPNIAPTWFMLVACKVKLKNVTFVTI